MGYNFEVIIKDGVGTVLHITKDMEDGVWSIGGNADSFGAGINVTHRRMNGQFVAEAQHFYNPENYIAPVIPGFEQLKAAFIAMGQPPAEAERMALQAATGAIKQQEATPDFAPGGALYGHPEIDPRNPDGTPVEPELTSKVWPKTFSKETDMRRSHHEDDDTGRTLRDDSSRRGDIRD